VPSAAQLRIPIGILDLEEVGARLGTGLFHLMLQEVKLHTVLAQELTQL